MRADRHGFHSPCSGDGAHSLLFEETKDLLPSHADELAEVEKSDGIVDREPGPEALRDCDSVRIHQNKPRTLGAIRKNRAEQRGEVQIGDGEGVADEYERLRLAHLLFHRGPDLAELR